MAIRESSSAVHLPSACTFTTNAQCESPARVPRSNMRSFPPPGRHPCCRVAVGWPYLLEMHELSYMYYFKEVNFHRNFSWQILKTEAGTNEICAFKFVHRRTKVKETCYIWRGLGVCVQVECLIGNKRNQFSLRSPSRARVTTPRLRVARSGGVRGTTPFRHPRDEFCTVWNSAW